MKAFALLLTMMSPFLTAQVGPIPGIGDQRLQTVRYDPSQVVQLPVAVGYQLTVELSPGEKIENAALGDDSGWMVTANKRGDRLFIKRRSDGGATNLTVMTDARTYAFDLVPGEGVTAPYIVRFLYPPQALPASLDPAGSSALNSYRMRGARSIWPSAMADDGKRTYIEWAPEVAMPAVFAIDDTGHEATVDGQVRDGRYVIDTVKSKLIFRSGTDAATAERDLRGATK
jgi:type IV secretion system protein VirB9